MVSPSSGMSVRLLLPAVEALRRVGVDVEKVLRETDVDPAVCTDDRARIAPELLCRVWERAPELADDDAFGLRAAEYLATSAFDIYGYIARRSATGREAFQRCQRYAVMLGGDYTADILLEGDRAVVRQLHNRPVLRVISDFATAAMVRLGQRFYADFQLHEVRLNYPAPPEADEYNTYFGVPVRFDCGYDAIVLPESLLDQTFDEASEPPSRVIRRSDVASERWWSVPNFAARARKILAEQLQQGEINVALIAKKLAVSPRTLRRKLREEGTSHAHMLDQLRHRLAMQYVSQGRTLEEIATALGFAHTSAFRKAFRRWTGKRWTQRDKGVEDSA